MKKLALCVVLIIVAGMGISAQTAKPNLPALKKAAESGDPKAQCELGVLYFSGDGVPKDIKESIRLFTLSAEKKYLDSQVNLGWIYRHTPGFEDLAKSAKYYVLAAQQGDPESQYIIALMYKAGEGLTKDEKSAAEWMLKAALQKHPEAQSALGNLYAKGVGLKMDKIEALKWYLLAKANGDILADDFIEKVKPGMTRAQITEAQKRAAEFQK